MAKRRNNEIGAGYLGLESLVDQFYNGEWDQTPGIGSQLKALGERWHSAPTDDFLGFLTPADRQLIEQAVTYLRKVDPGAMDPDEVNQLRLALREKQKPAIDQALDETQAAALPLSSGSGSASMGKNFDLSRARRMSMGETEKMVASGDRLLFGGAAQAKRYAGNVNYWGNDWHATKHLSNYAELTVPVTYQGFDFPSVEQAYVAAKFNSPEFSQFIAQLPDGINYRGQLISAAQVARNLGRSRNPAKDWKAAGWVGSSIPLREDWEQVKFEVMEDLVRQKFQKNPELGRYLLETGDAELIEQTTGWGDRIWGMVDPGAVDKRRIDPSRLEGQNALGRILMKVRSELAGGGEVPSSSESGSALMGKKYDLSKARRMSMGEMEKMVASDDRPDSTPPDPDVRQPAERTNPTGQETPQTNLKTEKELKEAWDWGRVAGDAIPYILSAGGGAIGGAALMHLLSRPAVGQPVIAAQPSDPGY